MMSFSLPTTGSATGRVRPNRMSQRDGAAQAETSRARRSNHTAPICSAQSNSSSSLPPSMISGMGWQCGMRLSKALKLSRKVLDRAAIQAERSAEGTLAVATLAAAFSTLQSHSIESYGSIDVSDSDADSPRASGSRASSFSSPSCSSGSRTAAPMASVDLPQYQPRNSAMPSSSCPSTCQVFVCQGRKCQDRGARHVLQAASAVIGTSSVMPCKCLGKCKLGVAMKVVAQDEMYSGRLQASATEAPFMAACAQGHVYTGVEPSRVSGILEAHVL